MTTLKGNVLEKNETTVEIKREGLCVTCKHSSSCMYAKSAKGSISNCEEFENEESSVSFKTAIKETMKEISIDNRAGLCSNCDNKETCTFERSESGVWHCEEYK